MLYILYAIKSDWFYTEASAPVQPPKQDVGERLFSLPATEAETTELLAIPHAVSQTETTNLVATSLLATETETQMVTSSTSPLTSTETETTKMVTKSSHPPSEGETPKMVNISSPAN